jgi:hypothetical protein
MVGKGGGSEIGLRGWRAGFQPWGA